MSVAGHVARMGNVAERRQIIAAGFSPRAIASALRSAEITRIRRAWFATVAASAEQRAAVRIGGRLGGPSALPYHGIWRPPGRSLHVSLAPNASRLRNVEIGDAIVRHWSDPGSAVVTSPAWRVDLVTAVRQTLDIVEADIAVAVLDSALHTGSLSLAEAGALCATSPPRLRHIGALLDSRAESGIESLVRVRLVQAGVGAEPQVVIPDVGRVDLLVGDRLVVEVDGREFHGHDRFEQDRARDLELAARGLRAVRLSYRQVVHDWNATEDALLRLVDAGEHLARSRSFFRIGNPPRRNSPAQAASILKCERGACARAGRP
jgi:very-short-patch-repair endonuclease